MLENAEKFSLQEICCLVFCGSDRIFFVGKLENFPKSFWRNLPDFKCFSSNFQVLTLEDRNAWQNLFFSRKQWTNINDINIKVTQQQNIINIKLYQQKISKIISIIDVVFGVFLSICAIITLLRRGEIWLTICSCFRYYICVFQLFSQS